MGMGQSKGLEGSAHGGVADAEDRKEVSGGGQLYVSLKMESSVLKGQLVPHVFGSAPLVGSWDSSKAGKFSTIHITTFINAIVESEQITRIPNTMDVVSNFPFLAIGLIGLVQCFRGNYFELSLQGEIWGWTVFFIGVVAISIGSSYYHLQPNDARLVWDRLPMTIAFASIAAIFVIEMIDERKGTLFIIPFLVAGVFSILYWR